MKRDDQALIAVRDFCRDTFEDRVFLIFFFEDRLKIEAKMTRKGFLVAKIEHLAENKRAEYLSQI